MINPETIRQWAQRKGIPLNPDGTIPEAVTGRYLKARAYRIRQSYAKRTSVKRNLPAATLHYRTHQTQPNPHDRRSQPRATGHPWHPGIFLARGAMLSSPFTQGAAPDSFTDQYSKG